MISVIVLGKGLLGSHIAKLYPQVPVISHEDCDILSPLDIDAVIHKYDPEVIINAAGVVPKSPDASDLMKLFSVNGQGPHLLQAACDEGGRKLIQISTDCVFRGTKGNYSEIDVPNPDTFYGLSKYLGEITEFPHLTIRTSFVGFPDASNRGLLAWANTQTAITGYDQYYWSGLTTYELAKILFETVIPMNLSNTLHIHGQRISKYELLETAKEVFGWKYTLTKESETVETPHKADHSLLSELPELQTKKTFKQQLEEMKA